MLAAHCTKITITDGDATVVLSCCRLYVFRGLMSQTYTASMFLLVTLSRARFAGSRSGVLPCRLDECGRVSPDIQ